jgi:hypothetical protein
MKFIRSIFVFLTATLLMFSCQKEYSFEGGAGTVSQGSLKSGTTGDCLPSVINGIYRTDVALAAANYIDVQIDVTATGSYTITSDTINGFSFKAEGVVSVAGINTIRLAGSGKPVAEGVNTFTIEYGNSSCEIDINVISATTGEAVYSLGGAGGVCTGATLNGVYKAGVAMDASNSITLTVDVTTPGTYSLEVQSAGGITFSGTGVFSDANLQNVTLGAQGTPPAAGTFNATVGTAPNSCTFSVVVVPATSGTGAVYTLGNAAGVCTGTTLSGNYMAGMATTAANTVVIDVNVATTGAYSITTPVVNGVSFSAIGNFSTAVQQTVTLVASGIPVNAGPFSYAITGASNTCSVEVTYLPAAPPASYTFGGAPGDCTGAVLNGTYTTGTATGAGNTVTIDVNVAVPGAYSISTTEVNGVTFSASGIFPSAIATTVTLTASGTPVAAGDFIYPVTGNANTCNFSVTAVQGTTPSTFVWKFNVGPTLYEGETADAVEISAGIALLTIPGTSTAGTGSIAIALANTGGGISTGAYSGTAMTGKFAAFTYTDGSLSYLGQPASGSNLSVNLTVYNTTTHIVEGTFSGTVKDAGGATVTISNGTFKANFP